MDQNSQIILACDDDGIFSGEYIPKDMGHTGQGKRHLAIVVLLYNSKREVLLQQRKHRIFDDIWDFTGATHPLHLEDHDETFEESTERCLEREYNIPRGTVSLKNLGTFNYFAAYKEGICENEHCAMLIGPYEGEFEMNSEVAYSTKWMDKGKFLEDIKANPHNYSPWAVEGIKLIEKDGFFNT